MSVGSDVQSSYVGLPLGQLMLYLGLEASQCCRLQTRIQGCSERSRLPASKPESAQYMMQQPRVKGKSWLHDALSEDVDGNGPRIYAHTEVR